MVADGKEGYFLPVQEVMQDFQGLVALFREASLVHEDHAVHWQGDFSMATLSVDCSAEHSGYFI